MSGNHQQNSAPFKWFKIVSYTFLCLVTVLVLLLALAFSSFGVALLTKFANQQEGIDLSGVTGSLYSQVVFNKLNIDTPAAKVTAENVSFDLGINCIFVGEACIDNFEVAELVVVLKQTATPANDKSELTQDYIKLPLPFTLSQMSVARLSIFSELNEQEVAPLLDLHELAIELVFFQELILKKIQFQSLYLMQTKQNIPEPETVEETTVNQKIEQSLKTISNFEYSGIAVPKIFIPLNVRAPDASFANICFIQSVATLKHNALLNQLKKIDFKNDYSDPVCTGNTMLNASLLNQEVNLEFSTEPVKVNIQSIEASLKVDLSNSFKHQASVSVSPNLERVKNDTAPLIFHSKGNLEDFTADLKPKDLNGQNSNEPIFEAQFQGNIADRSLPVKLSLNGNRLAEVTENWLETSIKPLDAFSLLVNGNTDSYDVEGDLVLAAEQPTNIKLSANVSLKENVVNVQNISTDGDLGEFNASARASITKGVPDADTQTQDKVHALNLETKLDFKNLAVQGLINEIQTDLNGQVQLEGTLSSELKSFDILCSDIEGKVQNFYLELLCDVTLDEEGVLNIQQFVLNQSNNSVTAQGKISLPTDLNSIDIAQEVTQSTNQINNNLTLDIDIKDLSSFHNSLRGAIVGDATVDGGIFSPAVLANLSLKQIRFEQVKIQSGQLKVDIDVKDDFKTDIELELREIAGPQLLANTVVLSLLGDKNNHTLDLQLSHPDYSTKQNLQGQIVQSANKLAWQGQWQTGLVQWGLSNFELINKNTQRPTELYISAKEVRLDSHCWIDTNASDKDNQNQGLCIDQLDYANKRGQVQASFDYNFNKLLIQSVPNYFYEGTQIPLNASIDLKYSPNNGVEGLVQSLIIDAKLVTQDQEIDVTAVVANFLVDNEKVTSSVYAGTSKTGAVGLLSEANLRPDARQHNGVVSIDKLILAPIQRFVPTIEKIDGLIQGRVEFDGPLEKPVFNGELSVSNAELAVISYPYPLKNFNQEIIVENNQVDIKGEFELGNGDAEYKAKLNIDETIQIDGEITGQELQLAVADQSIVASPDIKFKLDPDNLEISGSVTIPKADMSIKSLPQSARAPSSDVLILGGKQEPPVLPIGLNVDMQIVIDPAKQRRVEISALDLDATLQGDLRVTVKQEKNVKENTYSPMQTLVYGSINTLSGSYDAYGQNLQIQKGVIFFNGVPNLPQFDITAIRNPLNTADNVIAGIRVSGNPVVPKVELFSEPTMIQARQLSYLLQGTDLDGGEGTSNNVMLVNALVSFGIGNSENGINKLGQSLGFDSLNLQTAGQGENTQVQLSGRISDNIQITYGVGLFDQASELILKYQLMPQLYIEARSGATSAVDLFYEITRGE